MTTMRSVPTTKSRQAPSGQKGPPVFSSSSILLSVGIRITGLPATGGSECHGEHQPEMEADEYEDHRRDKEDMNGKEATKVAPPMVLPPRMKCASQSPIAEHARLVRPQSLPTKWRSDPSVEAVR